MKRRHVILMLGGASSGALSVGTGAFSSARMERGVNVNVVDDESAFVGYRSDDRVLPDDLEDGRVPLVNVTNQFAQEITVVDATIDRGKEYLSDENTPNGDDEDDEEHTLTPGESFLLTAKPDIPPGKEIEVAVTVRVEGTGVTAEVFGDTETRRFTIEREEKQTSPEVTNVHYNGKGTVRLEAEDEDENDEVEVDVYTIPTGNKSNETRSDSLGSPESKTFELNKNEGVDGWVVAVEVGDTIYQHPKWDASECDFDSSDGGGADTVTSPPSCN